MALLKLIILSIAYACTFGLPQNPPKPRTTIFGDEMLEGEIFENLSESSEITTLNEEASVYRLPKTTKPFRYDIIWTIDFNNLSFNGFVMIVLYATEPDVDEIVIHAADLYITSVELRKDLNSIPVSYDVDNILQIIRIKLDSGTLEYDENDETNRINYELIIRFEAELRTDMSGLYRSWFKDENYTEEVSYIATTQFQPTSARKAFPCYDEPGFKAMFTISVQRPTAYKSWSCTRRNATFSNGIIEYEDDIYNYTPFMSTYLIAIIVAKYDNLMVINSDGKLIYEVIARPAAIEGNQGEYAFEVGQLLLAEMSAHTAIDYYTVSEFFKMTHAAIPDFEAGAMENWGLLTYRESYLLYDKDHTSSFHKQSIAYMLSHEIAHMWFGNLVTCEWWDVLWLNEGFARYYEYFLTDWVEDYMGFATRFIPEQLHTALLADSVLSAHPLTNTGVGSPASIGNMFSTITHAKGASVIRMTEHLLGFQVHEEGLRRYLNARRFDVALPEHLFQALQEVADEYGVIADYGDDFSVSDYYKSWTEQSGHPVLSVQINHQTGDMIIFQHRFDINAGYAITPNTWIIPITFSTASNPDFTNTKPSHIISNSMNYINRGSVGDEWVIFNRQQTGFYRVNYDDYTWNLILNALKTNITLIHENNRAQIVNDLFQFARSGIMSYSRALNLLSFLETETAYAPWVTALTAFNWLINRLASTPETLAKLHSLITVWGKTVMDELTYYPDEDESFMRSYFRYQVVPTMCVVDAPGCRDAAVSQFKQLVESNGSYEVPVDSRTWVYCNGLRYGTESDFNFLWYRFRTHHVYTEKSLILNVLGCTPHQSSLYTLLDAIVEDNYLIRQQDYTTAFNSAVTGNEGNTKIVLNYIQNNLAKVEAGFKSLAIPLSYISSRLRTEEEVNEFQLWATENREALGSSYNSVMNGANSALDSIKWALEVQDDILDYIDSIVPVESTTPPPVQTTTEGPDSAITTVISEVLVAAVVLINLLR
ncbi:membrane alanyl aminopeptidase-like [Galleria mellonella]|uniref:Aminopeptidase n=1 Tax=Galleria mellonella TaxID=7137 RepID=A0ABM3MQA3_GALME|nr:membrane alanyl aminopeptidase-like [Galleria mellonella]